MTTTNSTPAVESARTNEAYAARREAEDRASAEHKARAMVAPISVALDALQVARSGDGVNDHPVYQRGKAGVECSIANDGSLIVLARRADEGRRAMSDFDPAETLALLDFFRPIILAELQPKTYGADVHVRDLINWAGDVVTGVANLIDTERMDKDVRPLWEIGARQVGCKLEDRDAPKTRIGAALAIAALYHSPDATQQALRGLLDELVEHDPAAHWLNAALVTDAQVTEYVRVEEAGREAFVERALADGLVQRRIRKQVLDELEAQIRGGQPAQEEAASA